MRLRYKEGSFVSNIFTGEVFEVLETSKDGLVTYVKTRLGGVIEMATNDLVAAKPGKEYDASEYGKEHPEFIDKLSKKLEELKC